MRCTRKNGNTFVISARLHRILFIGALLAYLALALPLPFVLLDHELGLLTKSSAHTILDDHAWLDHAAGSGLASGDAGIVSSEVVVRCDSFLASCGASAPVAPLFVRGPPSTLPS